MGKKDRRQESPLNQRLRPAPRIVANLIDLANSVPGKLQLPELVALFSSGALTEKDKRYRPIDFARIRQCSICNRIFWQGRKNTKGCSPRCGHVLASRRYRLKEKKSFSDKRKFKGREVK